MSRMRPLLRTFTGPVALALLALLAVAVLALPSLGDQGSLSPLGIALVCPKQLLSDSPAAVRVVVTDHQLRRPAQALVSIRLSRPNSTYLERVFVGRTDEFGTLDASFRLPAVEPGNYKLLIQALTDQYRESAEQEVQIVRGYRVLLTTDKPIYQPGQVMHLRALALRLPDLRAVANAELTLEAADAKGNKVFKQTRKTNAFGIAAADFQLADEVNLGRYKLRAILDEQETEKTVTVDRYVLPKFRVTMSTNRDWYLPGNQVEGTIQADYFFGKPVAGATVIIAAKTFDVAYAEIATIEGRTDAQGTYRFDLELPKSFVGQPLEDGRAFLQFDVEVIDTAEHSERITKTSTVAAGPMMINAVPEAGSLIAGQENLVYILVSSPDGKPLPATVQVLEARGSGGAVTVDTKRVHQTDQLGVAQVPVFPQGAEASRRGPRPFWGGLRPLDLEERESSGEVTLTVRARTANGETLEREISLDRRTQAGGSLLLRTDQAVCETGGAVQATAYTAPAEQGTVYFDVVKDRQTMLTRAAEVVNGRATLSLPLSPDLTGSIYLSAYRIMPDGLIVRDTRPLFVEPATNLNVKVAPDKETYKPGGEARIAFTVTDSGGAPVASALGVNIVDESVFALQELQPGMERVYFYLEQELMKPRYEIHSLERPDEIVKPISGPRPLIEDQSRQQAARVMFAAAEIPELPTTFQDTYAERLAAARAEWAAALSPKVQHIAKALETYSNRHEGEYPPLEDGISVLIRGGYLRSADLLDPWGHRMTVSPGSTDLEQLSWVVVFSPGPDGARGTEDDLYVASYSPGVAFQSAEEARERSNWWWGFKADGAVAAIPPMAAAGAAGPLGVVEEATRPTAPQPGSDLHGGGGEAETVRVRQYFPETMFTEPALITGADGKATLSVPMADSITTWRLTALANSATGQLGSTTAGLRCFQDFFIDIDLPVALTQNDEVSVPVAIYNYLSESQHVRLELTQAEWFELKSPATVEMDIPANNVNVRYFTIVARKIGDFPITVHAYGAKMSDAITRSIRIEPDGKKFEEAQSGRLSENLTQTVVFPAGAIPDANLLLVKVYPGFFSSVVEGLDGILQMPYGCFEQTSSATYPNILALDYMKSVNRITPEIQMKAEGFINTGYQRLVSYEVPGGGFSWFGSAPANKVLTAYGLMEFYDMARVHPVDPALIARTQKWLAEQQGDNGSWKPDAEYLHQEAWGRVQVQELPPTAYLTWALAWSGYHGPELQKAVDYLVQNRKQAKDPYVQAMLANALVAADQRMHQGKLSGTTIEVLDALLATAKREKEKIWWETEMGGFTHSTGKQADLETTGLAAIAYITSGQYPDVSGQILNYLIASKDPRGTWGSTQATVLALRALTLSTSGRTSKVDADVEVLVNGQTAGKRRLTPENSDVVWQVDCRAQVKPGANQVSLRFNGEGTTLYQVVSRYYLPWKTLSPPPQPALSVKVDYDRARLATNDEVTSTVTVRNNTPATAGMVIVDLGIAPGFTVNTEDFDKLVQAGTIQKFTPTGRQVIVYLEKLAPRQVLAFSYRLTARFPIKAQTPVTTVYEYYNPENRAEAQPQGLLVEGRAG